MIYENTFLLIYSCILAGIIGAVLGSFLNCAAYRIAHQESFLTGRSHCPACGHTLGPLDLIPIFSWFFLKGHCRYCRAKVPVQYLLAELFMGGVSIACLLRCDLSLLYVRNMIFLCCLYTLSLVDLQIYEIPNGCVLLPILAWLVTAPWLIGDWKTAGLHLLCGFGLAGILLGISLLLDQLLNKESLGGGDIKLFAAVGLYLGLTGSLFAVLLSCILGLICFFLPTGITRKNEEAQIPFGPAIAAGCAVILLFGQGLISWYQSLL